MRDWVGDWLRGVLADSACCGGMCAKKRFFWCGWVGSCRGDFDLLELLTVMFVFLICIVMTNDVEALAYVG